MRVEFTGFDSFKLVSENEDEGLFIRRWALRKLPFEIVMNDDYRIELKQPDPPGEEDR